MNRMLKKTNVLAISFLMFFSTLASAVDLPDFTELVEIGRALCRERVFSSV